MSKKILVAGGAGFVGSHTCKSIAQAGYEPVVVDNLSRGYADAVKWGPLEIVDIRDRDALLAAVKRHNPEAIINLSGYIAAGESVSDPLTYYDNNLRTIITLADVAREVGIDRFVFSSSAAVYGEPTTPTITEDHSKHPVNPYGATKWMGEQVLQGCAAAFGLRSVSLRYFNAAGADPDAELAERHEPETHLIPLAIRAVRNPDFTLQIFGQDYDTPDGTCIRDYIHVTDLAEAHVAALSYLNDGGMTTAYNVGTGVGYSVRDVVDGISAHMGQSVKAVDGPRRAGDPAILVANADRIRQELDWTARLSDLPTILSTACNTL